MNLFRLCGLRATLNTLRSNKGGVFCTNIELLHIVSRFFSDICATSVSAKIHRVRKKADTIFCLQLCQILTNLLLPTDLAVNFQQSLKLSTTLQTHRRTTL